MTAILLLHSARGLRDLEHAAADRLRAAGHHVMTPDLYDGEVAETLEAGVAIEERIWPETNRRAARAAEALPGHAVLAGFSMGANVATHLWEDRPDTAGLLLIHGLGEVPQVPRQGVPVQLHLAEPDAFAPEDRIAAWQSAADRAGVAVETFRYPGTGHLFTDPGLEDHDAEAADLLWRRALDFLDRLNATGRRPT